MELYHVSLPDEPWRRSDPKYGSKTSNIQTFVLPVPNPKARQDCHGVVAADEQSNPEEWIKESLKSTLSTSSSRAHLQNTASMRSDEQDDGIWTYLVGIFA